ncbi:DUF3394 domain-containing protein [Endozoicomonas gorgoniicola]|uniref:DUF3394 domain-containing protein n=1 Tax=Endozoicomonas gorgoniicola TaxID=1234144 RepID=A0ABT3MRQ9_9GAMM|nr:DUF3394 domain-containing protein [Endozoicomonas gorgoniicola]MCW7552060.1 DUF3394 domain-containing protein [Endozoicomonas gorgoniicola]
MGAIGSALPVAPVAQPVTSYLQPAGAGIDFDWTLNRLEIPVERPPRQLIWIPALLLLGLIFLGQRRRSQLPEPVSVA